MQPTLTFFSCRARRSRLVVAAALLALLAISGGALALSGGSTVAGADQPAPSYGTPAGSLEARMVPGCGQPNLDWNGNGTKCEWEDWLDFLADFAAGDPRADVNCDGTIDSDDFFAFHDLFAACFP